MAANIEANTLLAMETRYVHIFGSVPIAGNDGKVEDDRIPQGAMLARAEIPALIKMVRDKSTQFDRLALVLHAILGQTGPIDVAEHHFDADDAHRDIQTSLVLERSKEKEGHITIRLDESRIGETELSTPGPAVGGL